VGYHAGMNLSDWPQYANPCLVGASALYLGQVVLERAAGCSVARSPGETG